jgi:sarcosine oxidase delta subunit
MTLSPEMWAYCSDCRRWFYSERWFARKAGKPSCPVCKARPVAMEDRAAQGRAEPVRL